MSTGLLRVCAGLFGFKGAYIEFSVLQCILACCSVPQCVV